MIIPDDIYRLTKVDELADGDTFNFTVYHTYEVRQITDVRNLTSARAYRLTCTQRVVIPNLTAFKLTPNRVNSYLGYPALLKSAFILDAGTRPYAKLLSYSPRTVNSSVSTSRNEGDGSSNAVSRQHTTGSTTSETNTYGLNASFGIFGNALTGSAGVDASHAKTEEGSKSTSLGSDHGNSHETGSSESMSVKDWASYAYISPSEADGNTTPAWLWGQEYPWDVVQFREIDDNDVILPAYMHDRLFDPPTNPTVVLPPSQLSQFGVDFTMKAAWLINPRDAMDHPVTLSHEFEYARGSHGLTGQTPFVQLSSATIPSLTSDPIDITTLGLDPLDGSESGAVTGFATNKFISIPNAGSEFKIVSDENTLQVTGHGFSAPMSCGFDHNPAELRIMFKVVDTDYDYTLYFKHWKVGDANIQLALVFNGDTSNPIYRHIDTKEGEGGEDNLTAVSMRNKDYTSIDYHDYLQMGLNTVHVAITAGPGTNAGYVLRAMAIGGS